MNSRVDQRTRKSAEKKIGAPMKDGELIWSTIIANLTMINHGLHLSLFVCYELTKSFNTQHVIVRSKYSFMFCPSLCSGLTDEFRIPEKASLISVFDMLSTTSSWNLP
ncbi:hypothetical protein LINGRAPRIM_LOCUS766 [Linum grandiflorum]